MQAEMQAAALREARWEGVPAWKRKIIEQKEMVCDPIKKQQKCELIEF